MKVPVEHIALLARLELSGEEKERFGLQLSSIINYVEQLNKLDTSGVEPTAHVLELVNVVREDSLRSSLSQEEALRNAPDQSQGFYRVPKIIE